AVHRLDATQLRNQRGLDRALDVDRHLVLGRSKFFQCAPDLVPGGSRQEVSTNRCRCAIAGEQQLRPSPLDHPSKFCVWKFPAQSGNRRHRMQNVSHRAKTYNQDAFRTCGWAGSHSVQERVSLRICSRISVVEWSFGSPTIATRPPYAVTSSRSGTESAV